MKIIKLLSLVLIFSLALVEPIYAANTYSIDLELSSSQYLSIADTASLSITGDITIEAWVQAETVSINRTIAAKYVTGTNQRAYFFGINSSNKLFFWYTSDPASGNTNNFESDSAIFSDTGVWYHVAIAVDVSAKTAEMYVDGSGIAESLTLDNSHTSIADSTAPFEIGGNTSFGYYYDGLIDEVRVWNDIRTSGEISSNYQTELNGDEAGLAAYWKLNNSLLDETSNNNDLTNNNSAVFSTDIPFGASAITPKRVNIIMFE